MTLGACQEDCRRDDPGCNELANKHEYSLLQAMEAQLRNHPHNDTFLIYRNALDTEFTVIAFPKENANSGYVVLLADGKVSPQDKSVPDQSFSVTPNALTALKKQVQLSREVESYIALMATRATS